MYHLATLFPEVRRIKLPFTRDQLMMLMMAINLVFLGLDIYLAHSANGTIVPYEWIPIIFGPVAGVLLLVSGLIAQRNRPLATMIATLTLLVSTLVGLVGAYLHLVRGALPTAPIGERLTIDLLVWAPPVLGPLMFAIVGVFGLSAVWVENPPDSGILVMLGGSRLQLPYSKTRAYFLIVAMASMITVLSSVLDHARLQFENPWLWLPTIVGVFGTVVALALGMVEVPSRNDLLTYLITMAALIIVGVVGAVLHTQADLTAGGTFVLERFLRGAPFLAPMLFANVGMIGLIVLLDPQETLPAA
ncbi:MAG: hypothetical protein D6768_00985 [Chloroflexi bacterium]|nr:MAG: hypothetical protein D6768_00985 [Chloroflexota bacterium]